MDRMKRNGNIPSREGNDNQNGSLRVEREQVSLPDYLPQPTDEDISLAQVIQMDPLLASMAIQELFRRNRFLLEMAKMQHEALELLQQRQPWSRSESNDVSGQNSGRGSSSSEEDKTSRPPVAMAVTSRHLATTGTVVPMACAKDIDQLTSFQCKVRECLEFFAAEEVDATTTVRGRKKKVRIGQVGMRCSFCKHMPIQERQCGAVYYPNGFRTIYQAAHNIARTHLISNCKHVSKETEKSLWSYMAKREEAKVGKKYWVRSCAERGIEERNGALWFK